MTAIRIASSFEMRSRYLWRKRASTSARPCHFSGRGRSDLLSTVHSAASTVISPVRVRKERPRRADPVADVDVGERVVGVREVVLPEEDLDLAVAVLESEERGAAHAAAPHDTAGYGDRRCAVPLAVLALFGLEQGRGLCRGVAPVIGVGVGVYAPAAEVLELLAAYTEEGTFGVLGTRPGGLAEL